MPGENHNFNCFEDESACELRLWCGPPGTFLRENSKFINKFPFPWERAGLFMFTNTGEKSKHVRKQHLDINYGQGKFRLTKQANTSLELQKPVQPGYIP